MRDVSVATRPRWKDSSLVMRLMALSVFVAAVACAGMTANAHDRHGPGGAGGPEMMMFAGPPEHVGHAIDKMLDGLNASDAQRSQIRQIALSAAADLKAQRDAGRDLREKVMQIFTAPTVDASAAESLRQQMNAQNEQASKRVLQAMLDVSKVLTAEQRAKLGERMKEHDDVMHDRMRRMQQERAPHGPRAASQPTPQK